MPLSPGTRFGPYEIADQIGAGGMGVVYRATDTKLKRDVAIKVLPESLATDAERLARFQREAEVLASLNHPNIAQIHGLEDADGTMALVMELVEGPTLADRIEQGALPVDEALGIAMQIAEALEGAHGPGIVHRDLKPANIKLRPDGTVKVLDFGIAKALEQDTLTSEPQSPMLTTPATMAGVILGTAAYMSPEQARGKQVDQRADIWAFGCVLYEMLTGQPVFGGEDVAVTLARVLEREADFESLPAAISPAVRQTVRLCLQKDVRKRLHAIGDVRLALEGAFETAAPDLGRSATWVRPQLAMGAAAAAFFLGVAAMLWIRPSLDTATPGVTDVMAGPMTNTVIDLPANGPLALGSHPPLHGFDPPVVALAPDGGRLAYVGQSETGTMLYLREMAAGDVRPLSGTEGAIHPFFSPDGESVGFLTNTQVKKVSVQTDAVSTLADATAPVQGWWTQSGLIYFSEREGSFLSRVPADGSGRSSRITEESLEQILGTGVGAKFSDVLADGRTVLATKWVDSIGGDYAEIVLVDTETLEATTLLRSGYGARYVPPGYLVFARSGNLMAVRFDLQRREAGGEEVQVAARVGMGSLFGDVHAAVSDNGLIVYAPGGDRTIGKLAWVDRTGDVEFLVDAPPLTYGVVDLSLDGRRVAVHVAGVTDYIWIYDIERGVGRRLSASESYGWPLWRPPDGRELLFASLQPRRVLIQNVDGGGSPREPPPADLIDGNWYAHAWSPDGETLAYTAGEFVQRIEFASFGGEIQTTDIEEAWPHGFSPDGRFFAYTATSGDEIWVGSYPDGASRRLISDSGIETVWCPCGELFYRDGNRWFSTQITTEPELDFDPPRLAFETAFIDTPGISYAISPDGQRLLVVKRAEPDVQTTLHVVTNWSYALESSEP